MLPSAQIKLGASQLNGLIGSYTGGGGHYWQPSYTSTGTTTYHTQNEDGSINTKGNPWPVNSPGDSLYNDYALDASTKGQVTPSLTWVPYTGQDSTTDPPSSSVIVTESGSAGYGGGGSGSGAVLNDGWNDPPSGTSAFGTHYEVKDGSSGTISLSPFSLEATTPAGDGSYSRGAFVSVGFYVSGDPATITLGGTLTDVDGTTKVLTGQGVTAQLDGAPANVSSYTWSFTGGTPIKNWDPTSTSNDKTIPLAPADLSGTDTSGNGISVAPISFYYTKMGSVTVTCTLNFTSPDGKPGTMIVKSSPIAYKKPTVTWLLTNFNPAFRHPKGFFTDTASQQYGAEEPWGPINITVPDPFTGGHGYIAQVATLSRSYTRYNQQANLQDTSYKRLSVLYNDGTSGSVETPTGLDLGYPYPYGYTKGGTAANPVFALVNKNYTWEVGSTGYSDDQPFQYYATTDVDQGGAFGMPPGPTTALILG